MFDAQQKSTGTSYTMTVALLLMALVFTPAVLIAYRSYSALAICLALASSAVFLGVAWLNWKRHSALTIPSISADAVRPE